MATLLVDSPLQFVKGIGPVRSQWFAGVGLRTVGDLLEYFPFRHECEGGEVDIADLKPSTHATIRGTVVRLRGGGHASRTAEVDDGTETCTLRWFQARYAPRSLSVGVSVIASGKVQEYNDQLELIQPRVQVFPPDAVILSQRRESRRVGVYRGNAQLNSSLIRRAVLTVLAQPHLPTDEFIPASLLQKHDYPTRADAVRQMHVPASDDDFERARARLAYEEFLLLELAMALRRRETACAQTAQKLHVTTEVDRRIRARFPFPLTPSQNAVVRDIADDLESGHPMTRLLQGDVGSGKTVVALYACLAAIANGRQAALMAPTEILAQQHFANVERYLANSRVRCVLLRGGLPAAQRREILANIADGTTDLVVGTQALIQEDVAFKDLAVVVVDEQHKFGVVQRARFRTKGPLPHYLVMTATPIPRTLAMTVFGDLDVSVIKHAPPGRGTTTTRVVTARQRDTVMDHLRRRLEAGEQAYVVCPLIGDDEHSEADSSASAKAAYDKLRRGPWRGLNIGLLHGALDSADRQKAIRAFAAGELHALVATTVIEVGVDVPSATIMVVEHAERFGLSQLHQLRGRIGRGEKDALCVLITAGRGSTAAAERLAVMAETADGFRIAEADLRQRGPGELFGTRQHGLPELRVGDLINDFHLLENAREDAFGLIRRDPGLKDADHQALLAPLSQMFGGKLTLIEAG